MIYCNAEVMKISQYDVIELLQEHKEGLNFEQICRSLKKRNSKESIEKNIIKLRRGGRIEAVYRLKR